jgi:hypothetical protein
MASEIYQFIQTESENATNFCFILLFQRGENTAEKNDSPGRSSICRSNESADQVSDVAGHDKIDYS